MLRLVIASVARQSRRPSNDGSLACAQPQRDCHVVRQAHHERLRSLAMTVGRNGIAAWFDRLTMSGCTPRNYRRCVRRRGGGLAATATAAGTAPIGATARAGILLTRRPRRRDRFRRGGVVGEPAGRSDASDAGTMVGEPHRLREDGKEQTGSGQHQHSEIRLWLIVNQTKENGAGVAQIVLQSQKYKAAANDNPGPRQYAPTTTPLCQGERMNSMALHGHQTKVGTRNHSR